MKLRKPGFVWGNLDNVVESDLPKRKLKQPTAQACIVIEADGKVRERRQIWWGGW